MRSNAEIVAHLVDCARLHALAGDTARAHALAKAALSVTEARHSLAERLPSPGEVRFLGPSVLQTVLEFVQTGTSTRHKTATQAAGKDVHAAGELATLPGLGPVDAVGLWRKHGCGTVAVFEELVRAGTVQDPRQLRATVKKEPAVGFLEHPTTHFYHEYASPAGRMGDLHCHSTFSDGGSDVLAFAKEAEALGYKWLGICDHVSGGARVASLGLEHVELWLDVFESVQDVVPSVRLLRGLEVDVSPDGALLASADLIDVADYLVVGVHIPSRVPWPARLKRAFAHPKTRLWAHPAASLALGPPLEVSGWATLAEMTCWGGVALEATCQPGYTGLSAEVVAAANTLGVLWSVGSDAHRAWELRHLGYGYEQLKFPDRDTLLINHRETPW